MLLHNSRDDPNWVVRQTTQQDRLIARFWGSHDLVVGDTSKCLSEFFLGSAVDICAWGSRESVCPRRASVCPKRMNIRVNQIAFALNQ